MTNGIRVNGTKKIVCGCVDIDILNIVDGQTLCGIAIKDYEAVDAPINCVMCICIIDYCKKVRISKSGRPGQYSPGPE